MKTIARMEKIHKDQYVVEFSLGEKITISEDVLVQYRLYKGMELSEEIIAKMQKAASVDQGLQKALNYLSYQLRSKKEIEVYLKGKEVGTANRFTILKRLEELKLVDDKIYSESYVRTAMRTSDKGPIVISQQLKKRGLSQENIDQGLSLYTPEQQQDVAYKTAEKALRHYGKYSHKESLQKLRTHLMQKGFVKEIIDEVLAALPMEKDLDEEYELLVKQADKIWLRQQKLSFAKRKAKVQQSLFQKGFDYELIQQYIQEKELSEDED